MRFATAAFLTFLNAMPQSAFAAEHWAGLDGGAPPPACAPQSDTASAPAKPRLLADRMSGELIESGGALAPDASPSASGSAGSRVAAAAPNPCQAARQPADGKAESFAAMAARLSRPAVAAPRMPLIAGRLSSGFGLRVHPLLAAVRMHSGVDLAAPAGSPIFATDSGRISSAGWQGGYGLAVAIEHPGGMQTRYGHMSRMAVIAGQRVEKGQIIGFVGSTGISTGPHLHYEVRIRGQAINPLSMMAPLTAPRQRTAR